MAAARVHVAVGVVIDADDRILVARRPQHLHQGGLWEFPGGKVEPGEAVVEALRRELHEELAIEVLAATPLLTVQHDYGDKAVLLDVWCVREFRGEPDGREGQPWRWVDGGALRELAFPAANGPIITAIEALLADTLSGDLRSV
jgi:8-oxo-dGTP diphosphatase